MAKSPAQRRAEREARAVAHASRQHEMEEQRSLAAARGRVRKAVQAVAKAERDGRIARGGQGRVRASWGRGPKRAVRQEIGTRYGIWRGWPGASGGAAQLRRDGTYASTFHFALWESRSGEASRKHQHYIEREGACVASFGTLGETLLDRARVWPALERTRRAKRGRVHVEGIESEAELEAMRVRLARWAGEGKVNAGRVQRWEERVRAKLRGEDVDEKELGVDVWTATREEHEQVVAEAQAVWPDLDKKDLAKRVRAAKPKEPIVQRRITMELAHEVDDEAREEIVRDWCRKCLGDVSWHAAIHIPENDNDDRNYHAHIVYTQFPVERALEPDGTPSNHWRFEVDGHWPQLSQTAQTPWGNGTEGRAGSADLLTRWREDLASIQNEALRKVGAAKRYDHRSCEGDGDRPAGAHRGLRGERVGGDARRAGSAGPGRAVAGPGSPSCRAPRAPGRRRVGCCAASARRRSGIGPQRLRPPNGSTTPEGLKPRKTRAGAAGLECGVWDVGDGRAVLLFVT